MKSYTGYADWVRNSNSAAIYREAFALSDKMDDSIRGDVAEKIYRKANVAWQEVKDMQSAALTSSDERIVK